MARQSTGPNNSHNKKAAKKKGLGRKTADQRSMAKKAGLIRKKVGRASARSGLWGRVARWGLSAAGAGLLLAAVSILWLARDLPDVDRIDPLPVETPLEVYAADGSLLARYGNASGRFITYPEIPTQMVEAILAIEDRRFFEHPGFDWHGILRAFITNLSAQDVRQGGSTITQQLAKNLFLSADRTLERKAKELLLALQLESRYSKPELLALYLNRVYLGGGAYGIDAAAKIYFGHSAAKLSLGEAAVLAGLVKAPSRLAPTSDPEAAIRRAQVVLAAMHDGGFLSDAEYSAARGRKISFHIADGNMGARYFTDWVAAEVRAKMGNERRAMRVATTLVPSAQQAAEATIKRYLDQSADKLNAHQAALVALNYNGAVTAMVGGRDYNASVFNRAVQARRQPGSAFKPFVYLAAFEAGMGPETMMRDSPVKLDGWSPQNFDGDYIGPVTLRDAFAKSINTVAVKLSEAVDRRRVVAMAQRLGISTPLNPHPSIALGAAELAPLDLTSAYAVIAAGGAAAPPYAIQEIRSADGDLLYRRPPAPIRRLLEPRDAALMTDLLRATIAYGTGRNADPGRPAAGKTGTSQDYRDAWFVGFTADMVAGIWIGNDDNSPMKRVTGGGLPARIWAAFIRDASKGLPPRPLLSGSAQRLAATQASADAESAPRADGPGGKPRKRSFFDRLFGRD